MFFFQARKISRFLVSPVIEELMQQAVSQILYWILCLICLKFLRKLAKWNIKAVSVLSDRVWWCQLQIWQFEHLMSSVLWTNGWVGKLFFSNYCVFCSNPLIFSFLLIPLEHLLVEKIGEFVAYEMLKFTTCFSSVGHQILNWRRIIFTKD